ncbi:MAG: hypothetical protein N2747_02710 [Chitinophagaceae bacterium]|nr:hypothetical protein [Chitinophagaceae bacterium]
MNNKRSSHIIYLMVLVILSVICKYQFGPDIRWSGFSPVLAIALIAGFFIPRKDQTFIWPLLALFISDAVIHMLYRNGQFPYPGFYSGQWKNYLLILAVTFIGWALRGKSYGAVAVGSILSPTLFFLVSNFMVWLSADEAFYAKNFNGLLLCYEAGLPFYRNSLLATLLFVPALILLYNALLKYRLLPKMVSD